MSEQTGPVIRNDNPILRADTRDILFGRGKAFNNHPGNKRMREIVDKYRRTFQAMNRGEKRTVVRIVYSELIEGGARFLKRKKGDDEWMEVCADLAMEKVGHSLRCKRGRVKLMNEAAKSPRHADGRSEGSNYNHRQATSSPSRGSLVVDSPAMPHVAIARASNTPVEGSIERLRTFAEAASNISTANVLGRFGESCPQSFFDSRRSLIPNPTSSPSIYDPLVSNARMEAFNRQLRSFVDPTFNGIAQSSHFDRSLLNAYSNASFQGERLAAFSSIRAVPSGMVNGAVVTELYRAMLRNQMLGSAVFPNQRRDGFP
eukprot:scaffold22596_cov131-Cylindrotheca_fusiformis.AAC.10